MRNVEMWRLKSCPKCDGDMLVEQDRHDQYAWSIHCGIVLILKVLTTGDSVLACDKTLDANHTEYARHRQ